MTITEKLDLLSNAANDFKTAYRKIIRLEELLLELFARDLRLGERIKDLETRIKKGI